MRRLGALLWHLACPRSRPANAPPVHQLTPAEAAAPSSASCLASEEWCVHRSCERVSGMRNQVRTARQHPRWRMIDTKVVKSKSVPGTSNHTRSGRSPRATHGQAQRPPLGVRCAHATKFHSRPGPAWPCGPHLNRPGRARGRHNYCVSHAGQLTGTHLKDESTEFCHHRWQDAGSYLWCPRCVIRERHLSRPSVSQDPVNLAEAFPKNTKAGSGFPVLLDSRR